MVDADGDEVTVVGLDLPNCDHFADCLLRLPMFYELANDEVGFVIVQDKRVLFTLITVSVWICRVRNEF